MIERDNSYWEIKTRVFMHDPPDKALDIKTHEKRADENLKKLGLSLINEEKKLPDMAASIFSRIPFPNPQGKGKAIVDIDAVYFVHPLTGKKRKFNPPEPFNPQVLEKYKDLDPKTKFFSVWWNIEHLYPHARGLPAETRAPDHSIIDHCDLSAALVETEGVPALIMFKFLSPQMFLRDARKLGDFWGASNFLSHATLNAMLPILENYGPCNILFPSLRGNPLVGYYLREVLNIKEIESSSGEKKSIDYAALPHVFTGIIKEKEAEDLFELIEHSLNSFYKSVLEYLFETVVKNNEEPESKETRLHESIEQIKGTLEWRAISIQVPREKVGEWSFKEELPEEFQKRSEKIRDYINYIESKSNSSSLEVNYPRNYHLTMELGGNLLANAPRYRSSLQNVISKPLDRKRKCTVCHLMEAIVSINDLKESYKNYLKEGEKLCAPCFIKRFFRFYKADKSHPKDSLNISTIAELINSDFFKHIKETLRKAKGVDRQRIEKIKYILYADTEFLIDDFFFKERAPLEGTLKKLIEEQRWNKNTVKQEFRTLLNDYKKKKNLRTFAPLKYFALIKMDGDNMGKTLRGEGKNAPKLKDLLHESLLDSSSENYMGNEAIDIIKDMKPPITPTFQVTFSKALTHFSSKIVPEIFKADEKRHSLLLYSGGDDILALSTISKAFDLSGKIRTVFAQDFYNGKGGEDAPDFNIGMGSHATMSGTIVVAHHKHPIRDVITQATIGEHEAKEKYGRDCLVVIWLKHSGERLEAPVPFPALEKIKELVQELITKGISRRFFQDLLLQKDALTGDRDIFLLEAKRILKRKLEILPKDEKKQFIKEIISTLSELIEDYNRKFGNLEKSIEWVISATHLLFELFYLEEGRKENE